MTIWSFDLKVNGVDVSTYGAGMIDLRGQWDAPDEVIDEAAIPGGDGTLATVSEPLMQPKDFVAVLEVRGSDDSAFETNMDALKYALSGASLAIIGGNQEARQRTGTFAGMTTTFHPERNSAQCEIKIRCRNPLAYATSTTTVTGSSGSDISCALGTARSRPVITITFGGSASTLTLTYKSYGGTTLRTLVLTHAFVNTDVLIVDCAAQTVKLNAVRHDELITSGDFPIFDPRDGDWPLAHWPSIRTSAGALSATYTPAYL